MMRSLRSALALILLAGISGCIHAALHDAVGAGRGLSIGSPSFGYLVRPVTLAPRGVGYEVFRTRAEGGQVWGTARLVSAIERAARYVRRHAPGGALLRVGDLSARHGGRIERHSSHRNGRDVDLLFFALDTNGNSVPAPGFVRYDREGVSRDPRQPLRFDVVRNWYLVEALARDDEAGVVRIFCEAHLREHLLGWARAHGRDAAIVARAELLLRQPGDAAPHDDHFHVRIACEPRERALGCRDGAPIWWWLEKAWAKFDSAPADDETLLTLLTDAPEEPIVLESRSEGDHARMDIPREPVTISPVCLPSLSDMRSAPAHADRVRRESDVLNGPRCMP